MQALFKDFILLLFTLTTILVSPQIEAAIDDQVITNHRGDVEYRVLDENNIKIPNRHRIIPKSSSPQLKVSLHGAKIDRIDPVNVTFWTLQLSDASKIELSIYEVDKTVTEYYLIWRGGGPNVNREVCFHYGTNGESWYNTYQSLDSSWPMNTSKSIPKIYFNYLLDDNWDSTKQEYRYILEHLFLNTDGFAVLPDEHQPLFLRRDANFGDPMLCFSVSNQKPYMESNVDSSYLDIKIRLFASSNIRAVNEFVVHRSGYIPKPSAIPDESLFRNPTFHSIGKQDDIKLYTSRVDKNGFALKSQIFLETQWKREDLSFNDQNFRDRDSLISDLHARGYQLGVYAGPEVSRTTKTTEQYFIRNQSGQKTNFVDFSSPKAANWYELLLKRLQYEDGIDYFYLYNYNWPASDVLKLNDSQVQMYPSLLTKKFVETAARIGNTVTSRVAFKTQHLPNFVQLFAHSPAKTSAEMLRSLIPNVLAASIGGYSFVVPQEIGFGFPDSDSKISEEEYIRWVQATALMPAMAFARISWDYSDNGRKLIKKYVKLHQDHSDKIIELAHKRVGDGTPIVRPIWYNAPDDPKSYAIADQFMLGDDILVAPVLAKGQTERTVYLPSGNWTDQNGTNYEGPKEIQVHAPLDVLPFFKK